MIKAHVAKLQAAAAAKAVVAGEVATEVAAAGARAAAAVRLRTPIFSAL